MKSFISLLRCSAAILVLASAACHTAAPIDLSPNAMRELVLPIAGDSEAEVIALNGAPDHREPVDSLEMWIYARTRPPVPGLGSRTAMIWFRDGIVVRAEAMGGFSAPNPTLPLAGLPAAGASASAPGRT
jgi:hypothetical protein